jgi:hypothetical protein
MVANETGMVMMTRNVKIQLQQLAMALAWARYHKGAISAEYRYGPATPVHCQNVLRRERELEQYLHATPKKVLYRKSTPAAASCWLRAPLERRMGMMMKHAVINVAVPIKVFRRPRPSISNTEQRELMAYSVPPAAAAGCISSRP